MRFAGAVQIVLLGVVMAVGLLATVAVAADWLQGLATWSWDQATCTIESSEALRRPEYGDAHLRLSYRYRYRGADYIGSELSHDDQGFEQLSEAEVMASRYRPGGEVPCWVDPDDPRRSYLRRADLWQGLWIFVPLVFVAVGAGGLWLLWAVRERGEEQTARREPIAGTVRPGLGAGLLVVFFGIFFLFGAGFLVPFFVWPALEVLEARSWDPVPCEILSSGVRAHAGDDGSTYSIAVLFRYEIDGREYRSNRYQFLGGSSSGYERKAAVVARLPEGARTTCWVDPDDPFEAVVERGFTGGYLFGLVPLLFTGIGIGGLVFAIGVLRGARRDAARPSWESAADLARSWSSAAGAPAVTAGPMVLEPVRGPLAKLGCTILGALAWNGFISIFVWHVVEEWRAGHPQWFPALILTPFVLIGLLLLTGVPYSILALLNPRPRLHLDPAALRAGEPAQLEWAFRGLAGRIRRLRIRLEATETVSHQTDSGFRVESRALDTPAIEILDRGRELPLEYGAVSFTVPAETPPSTSGERAVRWLLKLQGEIAYWPDVDESYEVAVLPAERD